MGPEVPPSDNVRSFCPKNPQPYGSGLGTPSIEPGKAFQSGFAFPTLPALAVRLQEAILSRPKPKAARLGAADAKPDADLSDCVALREQFRRPVK